MVSMVELVGCLRVGTVDLYVWKSWLNRLDGMVKLKKSGYSRLVSMVESIGWHGKVEKNRAIVVR